MQVRLHLLIDTSQLSHYDGSKLSATQPVILCTLLISSSDTTTLRTAMGAAVRYQRSYLRQPFLTRAARAERAGWRSYLNACRGHLRRIHHPPHAHAHTMDIDDKGTRPPDRIKRRPGTCKCCAVLFAVIASFVIAAGLWKSGPWAMSFWHAMRDPHRDFVAANSTDAVNPLLGPHTSFDLGLTVWTRSGRFGDEVAIFSKIVMQDVTLKTKHREVEVDFDLPLETS